MAVTPLPALDRSSPTFRADVDTFFATNLPTFSTEVNTLADNVETSRLAAAASAAAALVSKDAAALSESNANTSKIAAAASAASAINAPGTSATSTTSLTVGTGSKTLTIQTGKLFSVGQTLVIASTASPDTVQMSGVVTAHDNTTGVITVQVPTGASSGAGTYADWTLSVTAAVVATQQIINAAGALAVPEAISTSIIFSIAMS